MEPSNLAMVAITINVTGNEEFKHLLKALEMAESEMWEDQNDPYRVWLEKLLHDLKVVGVQSVMREEGE